MSKQRRILVTGADGFIGKNLIVRLREQSETKVLAFLRGHSDEILLEMVAQADAIVHLAGENRPKDVADFALVNTELTRTLCNAIHATGRNIPLILASSTQATHDNPYGKSKLAAEQLIEDFVIETANSAVIYRLPGVFGKWCKPNYNSVVATFCHNIIRGLPIQIKDAAVTMQLVYIDDVVDELLLALDALKPGLHRGEVNQTYIISLGQLSEQIQAFQHCRTSLISERVGTGLTRALYSTYISYLPPEQFTYDLPRHADNRGIFVEMLKTPDCGQFSFFTVHPGVTRGSHYHHSKTEKFLLVSGEARMRFRHMITGETLAITVSSARPQVVDSIPGWVHDITNIGQTEAIIMLWANEIFDSQHPDCIPCKV
jgi:UDP-2-acetamido-2,6-beta-L-arabino-hexul-4-ose reductase